MTVRAEHPEVLQAVVVPDAVAVVDLDGEWLPPPVGDAASAATIFKYTSLEQAALYLRSALCILENIVDRHLPSAGSQASLSDGRSPGGRAEAEAKQALAVAMARVVERLDRRPVVLRVPRTGPWPVCVLAA